MGAIAKWQKGEYGNQGNQGSPRGNKKFSKALGKQFIYTRRNVASQSLEVTRTRKGKYVEVSKTGNGTAWGEVGGSVIRTPVNQAYYHKLHHFIANLKARNPQPQVECHCELSHNTE